MALHGGVLSQSAPQSEYNLFFFSLPLPHSPASSHSLLPRDLCVATEIAALELAGVTGQ